MSVFRFVCLCFCFSMLNVKGHEAADNVLGDSNEVLVRPLAGAVRGVWNVTRRGRLYRAFRGVRYAEPPVRQLRFQPPKPILEYPEEVDATRDGPACPMPGGPNDPLDEDCLRLNIYTPAPDTIHKPLPVVVFIHPGAFYEFSGRSGTFGPEYLLDRDLVLVTINYRLGTLGFLSTGDEHAPGNNGFKDQVAALQWIHRNIKAFGGDPGLVTITGCSAGSFSVFLHMVSPMSKGLFHHAISVSGSPIDKGPLRTELRDLAVRQAELFDCPTHSSRVIIDCLRTIPARDLGNSLQGFFVFGFDPVLLWSPIVEPDFGQQRFLKEQPLDSVRHGRFQPTPYLITMTRDEFFPKAFTILGNETLLEQLDEYWDKLAPISFMLPHEDSTHASHVLRKFYLDNRRLRNDTFTARRLGRLYGDSITAFSTHRAANLMCRNSPKPVFYGEFDYIGNRSFYEDPETGRPVGVAHQDDLLYLFNINYRFATIPVSDSQDSRMVDRMTAIWYNFARYGDPNPRYDTPEISDLRWPRMTPDTRKYARISTKFSILHMLFEVFFRVFEYLYPVDYNAYSSHYESHNVVSIFSSF